MVGAGDGGVILGRVVGMGAGGVLPNLGRVGLGMGGRMRSDVGVVGGANSGLEE